MHEKVLEHLGLLSILMVAMQGVLLGAIVLEKSYSGLEIGINAALIGVIGYLAYIWCWVKEKIVVGNKWHAILGGLFVAVGRVVTCTAAMYYVVQRYIKPGRTEEVWFGVILILLMAFSYIFMAINYRRTYDRIINIEMYVFVVALSTVGGAFGVGKWSLIGFIGVTIIGAMCRNQSSIDNLLERTQKNTPMVKTLRKYNIKWVLIAMLFLLVAFVLKDSVVAGLKVVWQGVAYVLGCIIRFLFKGNEKIATDVVKFEIGSAYGLGSAENGSNLYERIVCLILLVICIIKRKQIWAFMRRKAHQLIAKLKKIIAWLQQVLFHAEKKANITTPYYSEQVEELKEIEQLKIRRNHKLSKRKFEQKIKALNKIQDQTMQYRQKYKLLIEMLIWKGAEIKPSHTPREIQEEALGKPIYLDLKEETKGYEEVRYGERIVSPEVCQCLDEHLKALMDKNKS